MSPTLKNVPTLAIMIGIQASGKSTFCQNQLSDYVRINLDTLRTRGKERKAFEEALELGSKIVIDNTNPTVEDRSRYIGAAKAKGYRIEGYFMQSIIQDCVRRNETREGKARVPECAIVHTSNRLEMPSYDEGFDRILFVKHTDHGVTVEDWRVEA